MRSTVILLAIVGAALCQPRFGNAFGSPDQEGRPFGGPEGFGGRRGPEDWEGRGPDGGKGRRGPHGPPLPPYLRNVTREARDEFFEIVRNGNLTIADQKKQINEWGVKNNISDQVEEFNQNMTKLKNEVKQNVTRLIGQLSDALQKMSAILEDEEQTAKEMFSALRNLTEQDPPLYRVLQFANEIFMRRRGPRGGKGGRGGPRGPGGPGGPGGPPPFGGPGGIRGPFGGDNQNFGEFGGWSNNMGGPRGKGMGRSGFMGRPNNQENMGPEDRGFQGQPQFGINNGYRV